VDDVLIDDRGGWRIVTLNRPDRLNSFNASMHRALAFALDAARDPGCRAVLLTGAGRGFCAGQDLADVAVAAGAAPDLVVYAGAALQPAGAQAARAADAGDLRGEWCRRRRRR